MTPPKLDYERPPRDAKPLSVEASIPWKQFNAIILMLVGLAPLLVGLYSLVVTVTRWPQSWLAGSFIAFVGMLAGYVFTVRPVFRLVRGGTWWTIH